VSVYSLFCFCSASVISKESKRDISSQIFFLKAKTVGSPTYHFATMGFKLVFL
jgi:hypothetical protein